eukprot:GHUV01026537.1.p1 GENE.GHUV01026537.1~~GHUV01026537.1.p1  ORF type:complete len:205 (+),score=44.42 GHUV01026537.1:834-1448(+)
MPDPENSKQADSGLLGNQYLSQYKCISSPSQLGADSNCAAGHRNVSDHLVVPMHMTAALWRQVVSPVAPTPQCLAQLQQLPGTVQHILVPSCSPEHFYYTSALAQQYQEVQVWVPPGDWCLEDLSHTLPAQQIGVGELSRHDWPVAPQAGHASTYSSCLHPGNLCKKDGLCSSGVDTVTAKAALKLSTKQCCGSSICRACWHGS